jgi:glucose-6-phosphate 1-dehydrogenase
VEAAWRIVEPIVKAAEPVHPYFKGSWGPPAGARFLDRKPTS